MKFIGALILAIAAATALAADAPLPQPEPFYLISHKDVAAMVALIREMQETVVRQEREIAAFKSGRCI